MDNIGSLLQASADAVHLAIPKKGRMRLKYPSGRIYDVPTNASKAVIDQIYEHDKQFWPKEAGVGGTVAQTTQDVINSIPRTPLGSPDVARMTPEQKAALAGVPIQKVKMTDVGKAINQRQAEFEAAISGTRFGAAWNAMKPFGGIVKPTEIVASAVMSPVQTLGSAMILGDEKSSWQDRVGAAAELVRDLGLADAVVGKGLRTGIKALAGKVSNSRDAKILRQYLATAPPDEIAKVELKLREDVRGALAATKTGRPQAEAALAGARGGIERAQTKALPTAEPKTPAVKPSVDLEGGKPNVHFGPGTRPLTEGEIAKSSKKVGTKLSEIPPKPPKFDVGKRGPSGKLVPTLKPSPAAPETPKTTASESRVAPPDLDKTSISIRESMRFNMEPDAPDAETFIGWREAAKSKGYDTDEGAEKILAKFRRGVEPDKEEIVGLGAVVGRLAAKAAGMADGPERQALMAKAKEIRSIRSTETARALAARSFLVEVDYSPDMIETGVELLTGKRPDPKAGKWYKEKAKEVVSTNGKIAQLETDLKKLREQPIPKFKETGDVDQRIKDAHAALTKNMFGGAQAMVDPKNVKPVAALVRAYTQKFGNNIDRALFELRKDLNVMYGLDHTNQELMDAFKGSITKRNVTEEILKARRLRARATAAINARIAQDTLPFTSKAAEFAGKVSLNIRMLNATARLVDQISNLDEALVGSVTGVVERPLSNLALRLWRDDARFSMVNPANKARTVQRWISETAEDVRDASGLSHGRLGGGGPVAAFAGVVDAPSRAGHELSFAAQRAQDIANKTKSDFGDILDQIRDPDLPGPLGRSEAADLHADMKHFGDVKMHTDHNWVSQARGPIRSAIERMDPKWQPAARVADWVFFQFGKTLANLADKAGQYSNPFYAGFRAIQQLSTPTGLGAKGQVSKQVRAKQFAETVRRGALGYGLFQAGYYWKEYQGKEVAGVRVPDIPEKVKFPDWMGGMEYKLTPTIVETYNKEGKKTGNVYQDEGYAGRIIGATFAVMAGMRMAQIDEYERQNPDKSKQAAKMRNAMLTAPITDTTIWGNAQNIISLLDPKTNVDYSKHTLVSLLVGAFWPGQMSEEARRKDQESGVFGRRADGFLDELKRRTPGLQNELPVKARAIK